MGADGRSWGGPPVPVTQPPPQLCGRASGSPSQVHPRENTSCVYDLISEG